MASGKLTHLGMLEAESIPKRHAFITSLLGIDRIVVAVNKMDLVGFSRETFAAIRRDFEDFAARLPDRHTWFIPMSALTGDNVVEKSAGGRDRREPR